MGTCKCEKLINDIGVLIKKHDRNILYNYDEDIQVQAHVYAAALEDILSTIEKEYTLCGCFEGRSLQKVQEILEVGRSEYKSGNITPRTLIRQYSFVKEHVEDVYS